ncbi:PAS domain-containing sensor histidine kinase [Candidatus Roizmanbacteria bacterium]|nr:PAS domain-containing sensor histidine kinase [Candidatus Roizmanbacteria bacterium]
MKSFRSSLRHSYTFLRKNFPSLIGYFGSVVVIGITLLIVPWIGVPFFAYLSLLIVLLSALFLGFYGGLIPSLVATLFLFVLTDPIGREETRIALLSIIPFSIYGVVLCMLGEWYGYYHRILARSEQYYRSLVNHSIHPIVLKDRSGKILYASKSLHRLLHTKPEDILGKDIDQFIHPEDQQQHTQFYQQAFQTLERPMKIEMRMKRKDGSWVWMQNDVMNQLHHPHIQAVISSFQDISKQKQLDTQQAEILEREKKARAIAEKAVRDRDEFLSIASHELKTPLSTIVLQLQATLRRILTQSLASFSGEKLVKSLTIAEEQSHRLTTLIRDLLNFSLITTGRIDLTYEPGDLSEIIRALVQRFEEQATSVGAYLRFQTTGSIVGQWDTIRLEQCISNLLTNALKYGKHKPIDILVYTYNQYACIAVKDYGIGIPADIQSIIFEPFRRGKNGKDIKGLGVGLFIARQIALAHGGTISVLSETGKGTTFTVYLPLAQASQLSKETP